MAGLGLAILATGPRRGPDPGMGWPPAIPAAPLGGRRVAPRPLLRTLFRSALQARPKRHGPAVDGLPPLPGCPAPCPAGSGGARLGRDQPRPSRPAPGAGGTCPCRNPAGVLPPRHSILGPKPARLRDERGRKRARVTERGRDMGYTRGGPWAALGLDDVFAFRPVFGPTFGSMPVPAPSDAQPDAPSAAVSGSVSGSVLGAVAPLDLSSVSGYGGAQDASGPSGAAASGDGSSVTVSGNAWKQVMLPGAVTVESGMVLRFTVDVAAGGLGEIHGIGFDADGRMDNGNEAIFQVAGTQVWAAADQTAFTGATDGAVTLEIGLDAYVGMRFDRLVLVNDDDAPVGGAARAVWSDVAIVSTGALPPEPEPAPAPPAGGAGAVLDLSAGLASYERGQDKAGAAGASVSAGGGSITLGGNTWKQVALPEMLTVEADTVLRFTVDIPAGGLGEIHAIGLDLDNDFDNGTEVIFQLAGTQIWDGAVQDHRAGPTSGPVTVEIPLGAYAGMRFDRLVLANDDDAPVGAPAAMTVSDVSIGAAAPIPPAPPPAPPPPSNATPVTAFVDAGDVSEDAAPVVIDLLAGASDADGDALSVTDVSVTAASGAAVQYGLSNGRLTIDPGQFGAALDAGEVETLSVSYGVSDGRGGLAAGSARLDVIGADEAPPPPPTIGSSYVSGGAASNFNVEVVFTGSWTQALKAAFVDAAEAISAIVTGDLPGAYWGGGTIDDIRITAELAAIDGNYGIVGQAGPTNVRYGSYLPFLGEMTFDSADAARMLGQGTWEDVILHEMMHVLGFGTMWSYMGLTASYSGDLRFTGANAIQAYKTGFSSIAGQDSRASVGVPVETDGGAGTAGGHWDEATFGTEVMTGWVNGTNYVSDLTVAALEDMGYDTTWGGGAWSGGSGGLLDRYGFGGFGGFGGLSLGDDAIVTLTADDDHFLIA